MRPKLRKGLEPEHRLNTDFPAARIFQARADQDLYLDGIMSIQDWVFTALNTPGSHVPGGRAFR